MIKLTIRQAIALGVMACSHVADENPDLAEWSQAACLLRKLLAGGRDPTDWFISPGSLDRRGGRHKDDYGKG